MIIVPYYDALVLTLCISGFDVHRVLVDPASEADLLQLLAFNQMRLSFGMLNSVGRILSNFDGVITVTLGDVTLYKGWPSHSTSFILGCLRLGSLQCHNGAGWAALNERYSFDLPPNGQLSY